MMSKVSTMSRMTMFGPNSRQRNSISQLKQEPNSSQLQAILEKTQSRSKVAGVTVNQKNRKKMVDPLIESPGGLQVTINPITGHTQ